MVGEAKLEKWCVNYAVKVHQCYAGKYKSPARRGRPDYLFIFNGRVLMIEFKNPNGNGTISALQAHEMYRLQKVDCPAFVVNDKQQFIDIIKVFTNDRSEKGLNRVTDRATGGHIPHI